ncbi:MAG: dephospho-CoA kinase [Clostridia bacterium]|nr:dephospho-CoA kinase [Clostridia bacterium]
MKIYGLTGKTGAGKSTAAALLREKGWYVIDGDVLARQVTQKGSPVLQTLASVFGADILLPDGSLDRKALVRKVNARADGKQQLDAITHPAIDALLRAEVQKAQNAGFTRCVFDAAALLESPSKALCEKIIVVTAPESVRLQRIRSRDGLSEEDARARMRMQKEDDYYLSQADIIIENNTPNALEAALGTLE